MRSISRCGLLALVAFAALVGACSKSTTPSGAAPSARIANGPGSQPTPNLGIARTPPVASNPHRASDERPPGVFVGPDDLGPHETLPLLVYLHGLGGSGASSVQALGLERLARERRVYVYAPDGELDSEGRRFWNAHPACCNFDKKPVDDVARLRRAIEALARRPDVDDTRLYVMGHSNGGFMALRLACEMGDRLAAVASIAGAGPRAGSTCRLSKPLHVLLVHGDRDAIVRYQGGTVFDDPDRPKHESAHETLQGWTQRLQCDVREVHRSRLDLEAKRPGAETAVERQAACELGGAELWTVPGGSHFIISNPTLLDRVWDFFVTHPKK